MADKCARCGSADTMAAFDKVVCLNPDCGGQHPVLDPNIREAELAAKKPTPKTVAGKAPAK